MRHDHVLMCTLLINLRQRQTAQEECPCRVSYYCRLLYWTRFNRQDMHIAEVLRFVRASRADLTTLRLAVCRVLKAIVSDEGQLLRVTAGQLATNNVAMVEIDMLDCKLVTAMLNAQLYGMAYGNTSRIG